MGEEDEEEEEIEGEGAGNEVIRRERWARGGGILARGRSRRENEECDEGWRMEMWRYRWMEAMEIPPLFYRTSTASGPLPKRPKHIRFASITHGGTNPA